MPSKQTKKVRETLLNCLVAADDDGSYPALIQTLSPNRTSISIGLTKGRWKDGDRVRVTVERIERPQRKGRRG